jgi:hypothetical protein
MIHRLCGLVMVSAALMGGTAAAVPYSGFDSFYLGIDGQATIPSGTYAGQPNPNFNRLTLLYAHTFPSPAQAGGGTSWVSNHYHRIGAYVLTGQVGSGQTTFGNARVPEGTRPPIVLTPGSGAFAGRLVSNPYGASDPWNVGDVHEYTALRIRPATVLNTGAVQNDPDPNLWSQDYLWERMYASSNGRYTASPGSDDIQLEILSLTPGLNVTLAGDTLNSPGVFNLGPANALDVTPVFWVDGNAADGTYSALMRLVDPNTPDRNSGEFRFDFAPIPEPATWALAGLAMGGGLLLLRRRRSAL